MDTTDVTFEAWMASFRPWVRARASQWRGVPGLDRTDVEQAAWLGLVEALQQYRPDRGPFEPWAHGAMQRRIKDAVKGARRVKHRFVSEASALVDDAGHERFSDRAADPLDVVVQQDHVRQFTRFLIQTLRPLELAVLRAMIRGLAGQAVAQSVGMTAKAVDNAQQRLRRKAWTLWCETSCPTE